MMAGRIGRAPPSHAGAATENTKGGATTKRILPAAGIWSALGSRNDHAPRIRRVRRAIARTNDPAVSSARRATMLPPEMMGRRAGGNRLGIVHVKDYLLSLITIILVPVGILVRAGLADFVVRKNVIGRPVARTENADSGVVPANIENGRIIAVKAGL